MEKQAEKIAKLNTREAVARCQYALSLLAPEKGKEVSTEARAAAATSLGAAIDAAERAKALLT